MVGSVPIIAMDHADDVPPVNVSVVDVYDLAAEIGKECERIIDVHGADTVAPLMPKVINALELLETLAVRNEREDSRVGELRARVRHLETEKVTKAGYRERFEKELESIEEQWRAESKELLSLVSKLQEENRRLIKASDATTTTGSRRPAAPSPTETTNVMQKLQATLEKHRDEIRTKDKLLEERYCDVENLKAQVDRLTGSGKELRRKNKSFQCQVRNMCDERADFLVQLQDQQTELGTLRKRLGVAQKENEDLIKAMLQSEPLPSVRTVSYDLDDPNRPRFSTIELKDILHERNELKARVSDLEDELETFRPKPSVDTVEEEDAPVQGPLPYEPDDAPWKKSESGIRKFFRKIFSEGGTGGGFPRRSLSTLTKMALSATDDATPV